MSPTAICICIQAIPAQGLPASVPNTTSVLFLRGAIPCSLSAFELCMIKRSEHPFSPQQFSEGTFLDDATVMQNDNPIRPAHCGEPMSNDQGGLVDEQ